MLRSVLLIGEVYRSKLLYFYSEPFSLVATTVVMMKALHVLVELPKHIRDQLLNAKTRYVVSLGFI